MLLPQRVPAHGRGELPSVDEGVLGDHLAVAAPFHFLAVELSVLVGRFQAFLAVGVPPGPFPVAHAVVEVPLDDVLSVAVLDRPDAVQLPLVERRLGDERAVELAFPVGQEQVPFILGERLRPQAVLFAVEEGPGLLDLAVGVIARVGSLIDVVPGGVLGDLPFDLDLAVGIPLRDLFDVPLGGRRRRPAPAAGEGAGAIDGPAPWSRLGIPLAAACAWDPPSGRRLATSSRQSTCLLREKEAWLYASTTTPSAIEDQNSPRWSSGLFEQDKPIARRSGSFAIIDRHLRTDIFA